MDNNRRTFEWLDNGLGNIFIVITSWCAFVVGILCLLWGLFGGLSVFPEPPSMIVNHFKFCGGWKDQQLKATVLYQDFHFPMQVEGFLQGVRNTWVDGVDDTSKYAAQTIMLLQGTTVSVNIPEEEFELKAGKPIQLYYYRHSNTYGWEPLGRWKYYWDIWSARMSLIIGSLLSVVLLGLLLFMGCKAVLLDIPQWISAHEAGTKKKRK